MLDSFFVVGKFSEEKSKNFASKMLPSSFFMVHNTARGGHDNVSEKGW